MCTGGLCEKAHSRAKTGSIAWDNHGKSSATVRTEAAELNRQKKHRILDVIIKKKKKKDGENDSQLTDQPRHRSLKRNHLIQSEKVDMPFLIKNTEKKKSRTPIIDLGAGYLKIRQALGRTREPPPRLKQLHKIANMFGCGDR